MPRPSCPLNVFIQVYKCRVLRYTNIHRYTSWITASYMSVPVTSLRLYTGAHAFLYLSQPVQFRSLQDQGLGSLSFQLAYSYCNGLVKDWVWCWDEERVLPFWGGLRLCESRGLWRGSRSDTRQTEAVRQQGSSQ